MICIDEYSNSELEEMGITPPCDCQCFYQEEDKYGNEYSVCEDCGYSFASQKRLSW